jgi:hypothetical protein
MRAKTILPFVLLAIGALFLLSSCDAILDALYANNTLTISAIYVNTNGSYYGTSNQNSYVTVFITGASGGSANASNSSTESDYNGGVYEIFNGVSFPKLPNGNYTVTAYYYGYRLGNYYQYGPVSSSLSFPYNGSNSTAFTFTFP